jgi:amidohydrolase
VDPNLAKRILAAAESQREHLVAVRRQIHAHPELAFQEVQTARLLADEAGKLGLSVRAGVAGTGVIGLLAGAKPGKTVALRADIDALPLADLKEVPYASQTPGVGHLCGHDAHAAMALGAAAILQGLRDEWSGNVKFLFEPAEEMANASGVSGARAMVEAGALTDPDVDAVFALHVFPEWPTGSVAVRAGSIMAGHSKFRVAILGHEAHPTTPQLGVDAGLVAAEVLQALYTLPGRIVDPGDAFTLSVGVIQGGAAYNLVPARVEMVGSLRTGDEERRPRFREDVERVIHGVCAAHGASYELDYEPYTFPATCNDPALTERFARGVGQVLGQEKVVWLAGPRLAGETFHEYARLVPAVFAFLGTGNADKGTTYSSHHSQFDIDEDALPLGAAALAGAALDFLAGD